MLRRSERSWLGRISISTKSYELGSFWHKCPVRGIAQVRRLSGAYLTCVCRRHTGRVAGSRMSILSTSAPGSYLSSRQLVIVHQVAVETSVRYHWNRALREAHFASEGAIHDSNRGDQLDCALLRPGKSHLQTAPKARIFNGDADRMSMFGTTGRSAKRGFWHKFPVIIRNFG